jgi:hypothetical protein
MMEEQNSLVEELVEDMMEQELSMMGKVESMMKLHMELVAL